MNKLMELVKDYAGRDLCVFLAAPPESISSKEERTKAVKKEYLKWEKKKAKIQAIADQWERDKKDAERYRWLRDEDNWGDDANDRWATLGELTHTDFDNYIDAQI